MRRQNRWKQISVWTLASAMALTGSPAAVYAESLDDIVVQAEAENVDSVEDTELPEGESADDAELLESEPVEAEAAASEALTLIEDGEIAEASDAEEEEAAVIVEEEASDAAPVFSDGGTDAASVGDGEEEDSESEPQVYFEGLRMQEDYWTYVFDDEEEYSFSLNTESLEISEDDVVTYELLPYIGTESGRQDDEESSLLQAVKMDGTTITVDGPVLKTLYEELGTDEKWYGIVVLVYINDEMVGGTSADIRVYDSYYGYDDCFDNEINLLVDDSYWTGYDLKCYVQNADHPYGESVSFSVTSVDITDGDDLIEVVHQEDGNWRIDAVQLGGDAEVAVTYQKEDGTAGTKTITVHVAGDTYWMGFDYPDDSDQMLPGSEKVLTMHLYHNWRYSDDNQGSEEITDYTLEFVGETESDAYDTDLITAVLGTDEEGYKTVTVTANNDGKYWGTNIGLRAVVNEKQVSSTYPYVEVTDGYYHLDLSALENIQVGETLNLTEMVESGEIKVQLYQNGTVETVDADKISLDLVGWDECFEVVEGTPDERGIIHIADGCTLKRVNADYGDIAIAAILTGSGEPVVAAQNSYGFDSLDYSTWYEGDERYNGYSYYVFDNETDYTITLNTENLEDKDNTVIEWHVGSRLYLDQDEEYDVEFEEDDSLDFWTADGNTITIDGTKLAEAIEDLDDDQGYEIRAYVYAGGSLEDGGIEADEEWCGINLKEHQWEPDLPGGGQILTTETFRVDKAIEVYVEDADHPNGDTIEIEATGLTTVVKSGEEDPDVEVTEDGSGWTIDPETEGAITIQLEYPGEDGDTEKESFDLYVTGVTFQLEVKSVSSIATMDSNGTVTMPSSQTAIIQTQLFKRTASEDSENGYVEEEVTGYSLTIDDCDYRDILESADAEGSSLAVTSTSESGEGAWMYLVAHSSENEDECEWEAGLWISFNVEAEWAVITPETLDENPSYQETIDMDEIVDYTVYPTETAVSDNYRLELRYDEDCWTPAAGQEDEPAPELIRTGSAATWITAVVVKYGGIDKYGKEIWEEEIASQDYYFDEVYCEDNAHTWDSGTVTTQPTYTSEGVRTYTCEKCGTTKTEKIAMLSSTVVYPTATPTAAPTETQTTVTTEASTTVTTEESTTATTETAAETTTAEEHKHTYGAWTITKSATVLTKGEKQRTCTECGHVQTKSIAKKKKAGILLAKGKETDKGLKLSWLKVDGADGYEIYGTTCGVENKYELLKTTKNRSYTLKNLEEGVAYKFYVKAYAKVNGEKVYLAKSPNIHVAMSEDDATNVKRIFVKKTKISLKKGKTYTLNPTNTKQDKTKELLEHAAEYRYYSSDSSIAKVNSNGKITAKNCGTCKIYIVANSGLWKTVTVTVE